MILVYVRFNIDQFKRRIKKVNPTNLPSFFLESNDPVDMASRKNNLRLSLRFVWSLLAEKAAFK